MISATHILIGWVGVVVYNDVDDDVITIPEVHADSATCGGSGVPPLHHRPNAEVAIGSDRESLLKEKRREKVGLYSLGTCRS